MTHDAKAREVADNLALAVGNACCYLTTEPEVYLELRKATGDAIDVLRGRGLSGLRVVPAEPTEADVERCRAAWWAAQKAHDPDGWFQLPDDQTIGVILRGFLAQGGGDG